MAQLYQETTNGKWVTVGWNNPLTTDDGPVANAAAVTTNDTTDLSASTRALYVGGAGNVKVDLVGSGTVTFSGVPAGSYLHIKVKRVWATGTTATNILALW